ncbi:hypothetical protein RFI_17859, partial [Reticulomyxa filosa]
MAKSTSVNRSQSTQSKTTVNKAKISGKTATEWRNRTKQSFAMQVKVDEGIVQKGTLSRKGKNNQMKKYFCILLASGWLKCCNPKTFDEITSIKLHNCISVKPCPVPGTNNKANTNSNTKKFQVQTVKRVWEFEAETESDAAEWISAIS